MLRNTNIKLLVAVCTANLLSFSTGSFYSWSSAVLISLKSSDPEKNPLSHQVTPMEESLIASLLSLGAICGPLMAGFFSNVLGRKTTLMLFGVPMLLSNIIIMFATNTYEFYVARFLAGLGAGSVYTVVPMYISEIAETKIRGFLSGFLGIFYASGLLFNYVVGPFVNLRTISVLMTIPIVAFLVCFGLFIPESPYFYFSKGKELQARQSLMKLRKQFDEKELAVIEKIVSDSTTSVTLCSLFRNNCFRRAISLITVIVLFQQLSGITAILAYLEDIFIASGSSISSSTSTIIVAVMQVCLVILASCLADKLGRKVLLIVSNLLCTLALFPLGSYFYFKYGGYDVSSYGFLPISCVVLFIIGYNFGLCTIPWTLVGELFSNETKAIASSTTTVCCYTTAFLMSFLFPHLLKLVGFHGVFWFCGCCGIINMVFVYLFLPETKGKSFTEILELLEGGNTDKTSYETLKMSSVVIS